MKDLDDYPTLYELQQKVEQEVRNSMEEIEQSDHPFSEIREIADSHTPYGETTALIVAAGDTKLAQHDEIGINPVKAIQYNIRRELEQTGIEEFEANGGELA